MFDPNTLILVIDDMKTMRKFVIQALSSLGFNNFIEADNGDSGWEAFKNNNEIGIIVSDWNMPKSSGIELLQKIRTKDKNVPFLMITAESEKEQILQALNEGVSGYIVKPFTPSAIKTQLHEVYSKNL